MTERLTNFWIIMSDALLASATIDNVVSLTGAEPATTELLSNAVSGLESLFGDSPGNTLLTSYMRGEYHELTPLRENLQYLEVRHPSFIVAGCWDFHTGEPVGGAGSPWFMFPPELLDFMPE